MTRSLIALLAAGAAAVPATALAQAPGVDHVASEGVELIRNVRLPGAGMGGSIAGDRLFVTSPSHMSIFGLADPENPELLSVVSLGATNETEAVATNGRVAAVAEGECLDPAIRGRCAAIFDVDEPTGVQRVASIDVDALTVACVLDCRYLWVTGDNVIVDLADMAAPKVLGPLLTEDAEERLQGPCYIAREVRPGVALLSCDPIMLLSVRPEHGGSPERPAVVATATPPNFEPFFFGGAPHSSHWPNGGEDALMLSSTETPFRSQCSDGVGAMVVWDARPVLEMQSGSRFARLAEWRPANGSYLDGRSPYNAVGCSPHFLGEHPTFRNGGLVAQAALENGVRFLQIGAQGTIEERGWFLGLGGTAAVPVWHAGGRILYLVDYARGLDVLRYSGDLYVPAGTPGEQRPPAQPPAPARRFRIAGVSRSRRGTATIAVEVPGPGRLTAAPRARLRNGRTLTLRRVTTRARRAGLATLTIGATGRARRELARRKRLPVSVRITWRPRDGRPATATVRSALRHR